MRFDGRPRAAWPVVAALWLASGAAYGAAAPADLAYRNGTVYTVDAHDSVRQAVAIRAGRIVYVGSDAGLAPHVGAATRVVDLGGRMLMPGLVDGHMHPLEGGARLLKCSLNYDRLTVADLQARIQGCLDAARDAGPDAWLEVVSWFQEGMRPAGTVTDHTVLDALKTSRPIIVMSSFGHTSLVNSRAIALAGLGRTTPDPLGGRIGHDAQGEPSGILEDEAQELVTRKIPSPTPADDVASARAALDAMRRQGIVTFLDAAATAPALAAFTTLQHDGELTARAHFALLITPVEGRHPERAVEMARELARRYDQGPIAPAPGVTVRNVKLFLDGVISAPALTGAMLEPYFTPSADGATPWAPGTNRGPDVYFPAPILRELFLLLAQARLDPHLHADGDRAVREGLDAAQALRDLRPRADVRVAMAHDEIVDPRDFARFRRLGVQPVLSLQWGKPAPDTIDGAREYLGPARFKYLEPAAFLARTGARIAYGSDWPVDPLDEWLALRIGVTRENPGVTDPKYAGRLGEDAGLSRREALRAITMNAAYELRQERETGSIEAGKLADLLVLDRNVLTIPAEEIAHVKVLQTVVGGQVVYQAEGFPGR